MFSTPSLAQERNMDAAGPFPLWQCYKVISKNLTSPLLYWQRRRQTIWCVPNSQLEPNVAATGICNIFTNVQKVPKLGQMSNRCMAQVLRDWQQ